MCLECELDPALPYRTQGVLGFEESPVNVLTFIDKLDDSCNRTPLGILATAVRRHVSGANRTDIAVKLFGSYNQFLEMMGEVETRKKLKAISYHEAQKDATFNKLRNISHQFQSGLIDLFFKSDDKLTSLTQEFGVF
jgi:hypothetical protein